MKYKVVSFNGERCLPIKSKPHLEDALKLQEDYGLFHLTLDEVVETWETYSQDYYCASWLVDNKEMVEEAFGVQLEEIKE